MPGEVRALTAAVTSRMTLAAAAPLVDLAKRRKGCSLEDDSAMLVGGLSMVDGWKDDVLDVKGV